MTAPITLTVGGVDITNRTDLGSYVVTESGCRQAGQLNCTVMDAGNALTLNPKAQVQLWDNNDSRYVFTGYLNPAQLDSLGNGRSFHLTCNDLGELLDLSLVPYENRPAETFYTRMVYLISTYGPLLPQTWTYIDNPGATLPATIYQNTNLRGAIEQTCSLNGTTTDYWIDGAGLIHATASGAGAAPFALRVGTPSGGEINPEEPFSITRDPKSIINAYYIRGANAAGTGWVTDAGSISTYGRREAYYDAPNATTGPMRDAVGNALLHDNSTPSLQGKVHITAANGWKPGQALTINSAPSFDINSPQAFRINLVTRYYFAGGNTKAYDIQFGGLIPMWSTSIPSPQSWPAQRLASGSLNLTPFASTIRPVAIVATLPGLPDAAYPVNCYVVLTTDSKLYENVAGVWVNAIQNGLPIGFQPIPPVATLPTLPSTTYPVGFVVYLTTDGKLYRNVADVWTKAVDGGDITAATITGDRLVAGTITASQIAANTITASQILAATITAACIAAGAIGATQIAAGAVTAGAIAAGSVTADKLAVGNVSNAVTNPGFELNNAGDQAVQNGASAITGWTVSAWGGTGAVATIANNTGSGSGNHYCDFYTGTTAQCTLESGGRLPCGPGDLVSASIYTYTAGTRLIIGWWDRTGAYITGSLVATSASGGSWARIGGTATAPANTGSCSIEIQGTAATTHYFVDQASIYGGGVTIDYGGITITNGALVVSNPGGTVIIDGTSDLLKIVATGTIATSNVGGTPQKVQATATVATGITGIPANQFYDEFYDGVYNCSELCPCQVITSAGDIAFEFEGWTRDLGSGNTGIVVQTYATTSGGGGTAATYRYYIFKEVSF
jgi:hypothetical protein